MQNPDVCYWVRVKAANLSERGSGPLWCALRCADVAAGERIVDSASWPARETQTAPVGATPVSRTMTRRTTSAEAR